MGRRAQGGSRRSSQESWRGRVARPSESRQARHGPDLHRDGTRRGRISHRRRHGTHSRRDAAISGAATVWPWSGGRRGPHRAGVRARIRRDAVESAIRDAAAGRITAAARRAGSGADASNMNALLIVDRADRDLFATLVAPVRQWVSAGNPPPIILTEREWRDSADAFPIEYDDIREGHRVLAGRDPWHGIRVDRNDVRRQLEHELLRKLVYLRQVYAAQWSKPKRLAEVVRATWAGFLTMLRAVLRLARRPAAAAPEALVRDAGALIGIPTHGLTEPLAYLDAMTRTAEYVNRLERNPS